MKILSVCASLECGGAESHVMSLATALSRISERVTVASGGGELAEELVASGVDHVSLGLSGRSPVGMIKAAVSLFRLIGRERYHVVHSHSRLTSFILAPICKRLGVPLVTTVHARFDSRWLYRRLSRWGLLSIAVSEDLRAYLCQEYGISSRNTRVIANGIDTERFYPRDLRSGHPKIVFCSRLDSDCSRGAFLLIELLPRLRERFFGVEIFICGGGECFFELSRLAEGVEGVHMLGRQKRMEEVLWGADLFVGVSRAALEAMACGVPVVLGGDEGFYGFIETEEELARASRENFCCRGMESMTAEKLYSAVCCGLGACSRNDVRQMGRVYVKRHHSADTMARLTAEVYAEAVVCGKRLYQKHGENVTLCGYYGFGNIGDNALLIAAVELAEKEFCECGILALTAAPVRCQREFNVRCKNRYSPISVLWALRKSRALIFGGGTLLQDDTSLRSLMYYLALIEFAAFLGVDVILWGNGIGEPASKLSRNVLERGLKKCRRIGLRDGRSYALVRELLGEKDMRVFLQRDLAFATRHCDDSRREYLLSGCGILGKPYTVISAKGGADASLVARLCRHVKELCRGGAIPLFIPMLEREDLEISQILAHEFGGVVLRNLSESDVAGLIGGSMFVVGMRLHSLVLAEALGVRFIGVGDDPKITEFCNEYQNK